MYKRILNAFIAATGLPCRYWCCYWLKPSRAMLNQCAINKCHRRRWPRHTFEWQRRQMKKERNKKKIRKRKRKQQRDENPFCIHAFIRLLNRLFCAIAISMKITIIKSVLRIQHFARTMYGIVSIEYLTKRNKYKNICAASDEQWTASYDYDKVLLRTVIWIVFLRDECNLELTVEAKGVRAAALNEMAESFQSPFETDNNRFVLLSLFALHFSCAIYSVVTLLFVGHVHN